MLTLKEKLSILNTILSKDEESYGDSFNAEISQCVNNLDSNFNFLEEVQSKKAIADWVCKLQGRIVMHEDDARSEDIIDDYIYCG